MYAIYMCVCIYYILNTYKRSFLIHHNITCRHKCNISVYYTGTFGWENKVLNTLLLLPLGILFIIIKRLTEKYIITFIHNGRPIL